MKNKYYDENEFKYILTFLETNILLAKTKLEEYLEKYPKDHCAYSYYASVLITLGEFENAEKILNYAEILINSDKKLRNKINKISYEKNKANIIKNKLRLLCYQEKYYELYNYYQKYQSEIAKIEFEIAPCFFYCRKKLGLLEENRRANHSYSFRQIVRYEEDDFLEHIKKYLEPYTQDVDKTKLKLFNPDFPIEELIKEVKKYILSSSRLYPSFYVDSYVFKYNECGKVNGKSVDYFRVVCIHNTSDIITIYPDVDCQALPHTDLNYMNKYYSQPKTLSLKHKGLSQIEKFNLRYGNPKL